MGKLYNIIDAKSGCLLAEDISSVEAEKKFGISGKQISNLAKKGYITQKKYYVKISIQSEEYDDTEDCAYKDLLIKEWESIVEPLRKIQWVRKMAPGVRRLKNGKAFN